MRVMVTGGTGLVGRAVVTALLSSDYRITVVGRSELHDSQKGDPRVAMRRMDLTVVTEEELCRVMEGHDSVVHLMALTHRPDVKSDEQYWAANVTPTHRMVRAAKAKRMKSFVYMSSIKAVGESSHVPLTESKEPRPEDAYGRTKLEAERLLQKELEGTDTGLFVLRPPLVYGREVGGNLQRLARWIDKGWPLPYIRPGNERSMVSDRNLAAATAAAVDAPSSASGIYHVADTEIWSFEELADFLGYLRGRKIRKVGVPQWLVEALPVQVRAHPMMSRVVDSLVVDSSRVRDHLGWKPVEVAARGLTRAFGLGAIGLGELENVDR